MCTEGKFCFLDLPIAGYVLGVLHIIWSLFNIISNIILITGSENGGEHGRKNYRMLVIGPITRDGGDGSSGTSTAQPIGQIIVSIISIVFSVLLIIGIKKGKKIFVTAYYIFGIVLTVLMCLGLIMMFIVSQIILGTVSLVTIIVYIIILVFLVRKLRNSMSN